jgi:hypothetical protein
MIYFFLFLVLNATFSNISAILWRPVLVVEEAGVPGKNHHVCILVFWRKSRTLVFLNYFQLMCTYETLVAQ